MKITVIITVKSKISGAYMRDTQELTASELCGVVNDYTANNFEVVALEEIDETVEEFYSKRMTDADLDAMAADIPE